MLQAFRDLRIHVESVVSRLLESEPDQFELIHDELHAFSAELESVWACHVVQSPVVSPAAETATDGLPPSHLVVQPLSNDQETGIASLAIAASNLISRKQEPIDSPECPTHPHHLSHDATSNTDTSRCESFRDRNSTQAEEVLRPHADTSPCRNLVDAPEPHQLFSDTITSQQLSSSQALEEPNLGT